MISAIIKNPIVLSLVTVIIVYIVLKYIRDKQEKENTNEDNKLNNKSLLFYSAMSGVFVFICAFGYISNDCPDYDKSLRNIDINIENRVIKHIVVPDVFVDLI